MILLRNFRCFSILTKYFKPKIPKISLNYSKRIPQVSKTSTPITTKVSSISNFTIITECSEFPSNIQIGLLYPIGSSNENLQNTGLLQSIKNTYLYPFEQDHYTRLQLMGSKLFMDFDHESTYFSGFCLAEDLFNFLQILFSITNHEKNSKDQEIIDQRHSEF